MSADPKAPPVPEIPKAHDSRLVVTLFALAPDIVHPISLDFDKKGRLLVIESHTHFPPKNYAGPKHDRIRLIEDTDGDGKADRFTTFFEGLTKTMDLAVHPDGAVYVATRNEILRLRDTDGDGKADQRERLVFLDTKGDYPHNGLAGLCFDAQGNLFFGMGENLGAAYKLIGADGTTLNGEGEGGNVFWCTADGKKLRRVATGFWNPFGVCRDGANRYFVVDNDPDAMPPCRLLHLVEGGDYGFQFRYGRSGRHVFQAWNGQLPGTLPMMSGTGEAPCEVLSYEAEGLPREYLGSLLVTAWADHRVERYVLKEHGTSFTAERKPFVQGGKDFRPVGMAVAPDGSLFVSDWVLKDYTLHGRGAIWHIQMREPQKKERLPPPAARHAGEVRREALATLNAPADVPRLLALTTDADPFLRHAAVQQLARQFSQGTVLDPRTLPDARQRVGLLLAQRASALPAGQRLLPTYLADRDEDVRFLAAKWIADEKLIEYRPQLVEALKDRTLNVRLYAAFATALARVDGQEVSDAKLADYFLDRLADGTTPAAMRRQALMQVPASHKKLTVALLGKLLAHDDSALQREAARALAEHADPKRHGLLLAAARNERLSDDVRAHALAGLAHPAAELVVDVFPFTSSAQPTLRAEALRSLLQTKLTPLQQQQLAELPTRHPDTADLAARVLGKPFFKDRPPAKDLDTWLKRLEGPADADAGRRVFAHPKLAGCARCHRAEGRGHEVGPDLSTIGRTERRSILESILQPSNNVAPHYQSWLLATADGKVHTGMLVRTYLDEYTYLDEKGQQFTLNTRDIVESRPAPTSIMPEGLVDLLTDQEVRDLLAYLCSLR